MSKQQIIRHENHADRGVVTKQFLLDVVWNVKYPNRICRDKTEFLKRQKILPFWKERHLQKDKVLNIAKQIKGEFTTLDIADAMKVDEYPVRAAMSWLVRNGIVEKCGNRESLTKLRHVKYTAALYRVKPEATDVDFKALMGVFCRG